MKLGQLGEEREAHREIIRTGMSRAQDDSRYGLISPGDATAQQEMSPPDSIISMVFTDVVCLVRLY